MPKTSVDTSLQQSTSPEKVALSLDTARLIFASKPKNIRHPDAISQNLDGIKNMLLVDLLDEEENLDSDARVSTTMIGRRLWEPFLFFVQILKTKLGRK